jgi:hypothetical protein
MPNDVEHLVMYFLAICLSLLVKGLSVFCLLKKLGCLIVLLLSCESSLPVLVLLRYTFWKHFLLLCQFLKILFTWAFMVQNLLILKKSNLLMYFYRSCFLVSTLPSSRFQYLLLFFSCLTGMYYIE